MEVKKRILLVEDDEAVGYLLSEYLRMKGFELSWAKQGKEALVKLDQSNYDLAILDVMMPEMDGFTLAEKMNEDYSNLPFIFLTAKSLKVDVLKGFYLGAVDYLKKPIDEEELVIRIENLLSRLDNTASKKVEVDAYTIGKYHFNSLNQELVVDDQKINLTVKESELLKYLVDKKNQLCPHKDILIKIWGKNDYFNKKSLNVFITRLRKFLERDSRIKIENVHSKGYILRFEP
ncbi:response regulator transcription factor [Maribacter cobaltidurans]|uniref:Two-component system response regulator n=1 Tax=Maribacter cobaltidurans TaxID=1178778 RepID=A0A223V756_9FLAO|nr:response regulator transcription factor [Maribacter cobaltidurans]ASV31253.1 two-component system response regulator [Maribacter cobaltidurans]GGD83842.1 transcriptional regulator [Maribacter cobaltidurans]